MLSCVSKNETAFEIPPRWRKAEAVAEEVPTPGGRRPALCQEMTFFGAGQRSQAGARTVAKGRKRTKDLTCWGASPRNVVTADIVLMGCEVGAGGKG